MAHVINQDGSLPLFDLVFTFSSVEHSGLGRVSKSVRLFLYYNISHTAGRYGDPLNPWGDIITIAQAWCASTPEVSLALPWWIEGGEKLPKLNCGAVFVGLLSENDQRQDQIFKSIYIFTKILSAFIQQAHLVLGVPTDVLRKDGSPGEDNISFNAHRCHHL